MFTLPTIVKSTAKLLYRRLREAAYEDMARQASDWIPEELRIETKGACTPINLNFNVPKNHRLDWIRRTIQYLPH